MRRINESLLLVILNEVRNNGKITENELAIKYSYTERTIRRYFKVLKDKKIIKLYGVGKKRRWKIIR